MDSYPKSSNMKQNAFPRFIQSLLLKDLKKKMVFLTGPRQTGKTWMAKALMKYYKNPLYLNYDSFKDKKIIEEQSWPQTGGPQTGELQTGEPEPCDFIIFDEIHKMEQWKNYIKGVFDTRPPQQHILVTGSARLEHISRSGDSLAGRYLSHTLLPFSLFELRKSSPLFSFRKLWTRGGFPEPLLLSEDENSAERWREQYLLSLIREDIPDFKSFQNYKKLETLLFLLKEQVGSPVSIQSLALTLKIDHKTVIKYLSVLEDLFIVFSVPAFSTNITRSLSKQRKIYFYDFAFIDSSDKGKRLENLVALHLLKKTLFLKENSPKTALSLYYLRTKDQKEVDFLLVKNKTPQFMVEVKTKEVAFSKSLIYFYDRYNIKGIQLSLNLKRPQQIKGKKVFSEDLERFLLQLKV